MTVQCYKTQAEREKRIEELRAKIASQKERLKDGWSDDEIEYYQLVHGDDRPLKKGRSPYKRGGHGRCRYTPRRPQKAHNQRKSISDHNY